jgi:hypothetical protein
MTLETVSSVCDASAIGAIFASFSAGSGCLIHGSGPCCCYTNVNTNDYTVTWTCGVCGVTVPFGANHLCTAPGTPWTPMPYVPAAPFTISISLPECAFCDKLLEVDDKKLCKECRGVFEAWKFLAKKDEPEKEPGAGE